MKSRLRDTLDEVVEKVRRAAEVDEAVVAAVGDDFEKDFWWESRE